MVLLLLCDGESSPKQTTGFLIVLQIGASGVELLWSAGTFWGQSGLVYRTEFPILDSEKSGRIVQILKNKILWIFAAFVFGYVGVEG